MAPDAEGFGEGPPRAAGPRRPLAFALARDLRDFMEARGFREPAAALAERVAAAPRVTFRDTLLEMIRSRGLVDSRVCNAAGVDRRHYSKIRNDPDYHPKKETALSFAFALRLDPGETRRLLQAAGYAFTEGSRRDLICSYFLETRTYDAAVVNDALYSYDEPLLFGVREK